MNAFDSSMQKLNKDPNMGPDGFYSVHMAEIMEIMENIVHPAVKTLTGNNLVQGLHTLADVTHTLLNMKDATQCSKQECSFCCHSEIFISPTEAAYIKDKATYVIDEEKQKRQRKAADYNDLNFADKGCIMLKDGKCQVYAHRPLLCRNYGVAAGVSVSKCEEQANNLGNVFVDQPRSLLLEALNLYLPANRKEFMAMKNIADYDWKKSSTT